MPADGDKKGNVLGWDKFQNEVHKCHLQDIHQMTMRFTHWMPLPYDPDDEREKHSGITAKWNEDEQVYDFIDGKGERIEAVEFLEWVLKQGYDMIVGTNICKKHGGFQNTTPELYELFLKSKSKP